MTVLDREKIIAEYFGFTKITDNGCGAWEVCLKTGDSAKFFDLALEIREYNMTLFHYGTNLTDWAYCSIPHRYNREKSYFKDEDALRDGLEYIRLSLIHIWQDIMLSCKPRPQGSILD